MPYKKDDIRPAGTIPTEPDKWCPFCLSSSTAIRDPEERHEKLKGENKKLRDRIRELTYEEDYSWEHDSRIWQTFHGVRDWHFIADMNAWPRHLPSGYQGRVQLMINYGGGSLYHDWQYTQTSKQAEEYARRLNEITSPYGAHGIEWRNGLYVNFSEDRHMELIRRPSLDHFPILYARIPLDEWRAIQKQLRE